MKNSLLIMNMILIIFITKSKADLFKQFRNSYEPVLKHQNVNAFADSLSEKKFEEILNEVTPYEMSLRNQELNLPQETNKETLDNSISGGFTIKSINQKDVDEMSGVFPPRSHLVEYYSELVNILGKQFQEVEVISKPNEIDIIEHTNGQAKNSEDQNKKSDQKSKLYAFYPYQPKSDESTSINGPITHLPNEEEASSPFWYYQPTDRKQPRYSYLPTKKSQLFKLFPSLELKSSGIYSSNKQMNAKKIYQRAKGTSSKISLDRQNMAWPFGYDLNQSPVEYSLLHKIDMRPNPYVNSNQQE